MKKYLLIFAVLCINIATFADPAYPDSIRIIQPDGDTLWTYLRGDEFYHWRSTIDGHVIMRDSNNCFRYAVIDADSLKASNQIAHNVEGRSIIESEFINNNTPLVKQFIQMQ